LHQDATELVSRLASFHYTAQTRPEKKHYAQYGLDLVDGVVRDNVEAGVLEPVLSKVKIVQVGAAVPVCPTQLKLPTRCSEAEAYTFELCSCAVSHGQSMVRLCLCQ
jgi:hypothetical protein